MDHALRTALPTLRPARRPSPLALLLGLAALRRSRRRLRDLDDRLLRDCGLSPTEAACEAGRLAWDVPGHWLR